VSGAQAHGRPYIAKPVFRTLRTGAQGPSKSGLGLDLTGLQLAGTCP